AGERLPDRAGRSGGGEREVRHSTHGHRHAQRAHAAREQMTTAAHRAVVVIPSRRRGISAQRKAEIPRRSAPRNDMSWAVLGLALFATPAHAKTPAPEGPSLLPLVLTFVFVLALIPVAVWMMKRLGAGNVSATAGMRVVAQLTLGQRERLVVVEAGER